jgi:hypothetical protein
MNSPCALCLCVKPLCKSHVVPEFCYKPAYDAKHRLVEYDPVTKQKTGLPQKGLYCPLLCADCERLINDKYERPFLNYWQNGEVLAQLATEELVVLDGIDYAKFKLFHLSVLFRANASTLSNFADIQLGSHAETIRQMVLSGDCGDHSQYPILCSAICDNRGEILFALVGPGHMIDWDGAKGFCFTFCGCEWRYMLALDEITEYRGYCLQPNGTLPVIKEYPSSLSYYRMLRDSEENKC